MRKGEIQLGVFLKDALNEAPSDGSVLEATSSKHWNGDIVWTEDGQLKFVPFNTRSFDRNSLTSRLGRDVASFELHGWDRDDSVAKQISEAANEYVSAMNAWWLPNSDYDTQDYIAKANTAFSRLMGFCGRYSHNVDSRDTAKEIDTIARRLSARLDMERRMTTLRLGRFIYDNRGKLWVSDRAYDSYQDNSMKIAMLAGIAVESLAPRHQIELDPNAEMEMKGLGVSYAWELHRKKPSAVIQDESGNVYIMPMAGEYGQYCLYSLFPKQAEIRRHKQQYDKSDIKELRNTKPYEFGVLARDAIRRRNVRISQNYPATILP